MTEASSPGLKAQERDGQAVICINGYRLQVAIEDRFLVFCLREENHPLPYVESFDAILATARSLDPGIQVLCDLRGARAIYNDIPEALGVAVQYGAQLLAPPQGSRA